MTARFLICISLVFGFAFQAQADSCQKVYQPARLIQFQDYHPSRVDYKTVPNMPAVKDQCSTQACAYFSFFSYLEQTRPTYPEISRDHTVLALSIVGSVAELAGGKNSLVTNGKGLLANLKSLGMMPSEKFQVPFNFMQGPNYFSWNSVLLNQLRQAKIEAQNDPLNFASQVRQRLQGIVQEFGLPDFQQFDYQGTTWTAHEWAQAMFGGRGRWMVLNADFKLSPYQKAQEKIEDEILVQQVSPESISSYLLDRVQRGFSTPIGLSLENALIDHQSGVMAIQGMTRRTGFSPLTREMRAEFPDEVGHAMLVVGVLKDSQGKPEWWLVQDSYGANQADSGYWHVRNDYLVEYWISVFHFEKDTPLGQN